MKKNILILLSYTLVSCNTHVQNDSTQIISIVKEDKSNTLLDKSVSESFIAPNSISINIHETAKLYGTVKYTDNTTDKDFNWNIIGDTVTVDKDGNIKPLKIGDSTAILIPNKDKSKIKSIPIKVNPIGQVKIRNAQYINSFKLHANQKENFVLAWTEYDNNQGINIYSQKFNSNLLPDSEPELIGYISNFDYKNSKLPLKVLINENGDYIVSYLINNNIIIHKFKDKVQKTIIIDEPNLVNSFSIDISNDIISVIWDINHNGVYNKVYNKTYDFEGNIIIDKTQINAETNEYNASRPRVNITDKINIFYFINGNSIISSYDFKGKFLNKESISGYLKDKYEMLYTITNYTVSYLSNDITYFSKSETDTLFFQKLNKYSQSY